MLSQPGLRFFQQRRAVGLIRKGDGLLREVNIGINVSLIPHHCILRIIDIIRKIRIRLDLADAVHLQQLRGGHAMVGQVPGIFLSSPAAQSRCPKQRG